MAAAAMLLRGPAARRSRRSVCAAHLALPGFTAALARMSAVAMLAHVSAARAAYAAQMSSSIPGCDCCGCCPTVAALGAGAPTGHAFLLLCVACALWHRRRRYRV